MLPQNAAPDPGVASRPGGSGEDIPASRLSGRGGSVQSRDLSATRGRPLRAGSIPDRSRTRGQSRRRHRTTGPGPFGSRSGPNPSSGPVPIRSPLGTRSVPCWGPDQFPGLDRATPPVRIDHPSHCHWFPFGNAGPVRSATASTGTASARYPGRSSSSRRAGRSTLRRGLRSRGTADTGHVTVAPDGRRPRDRRPATTPYRDPPVVRPSQFGRGWSTDASVSSPLEPGGFRGDSRSSL